jgi:predicted enzyme related to lactoylglutathione lyase
MKLSYITIFVDDLNKMIEFYKAVFGLELKFIHESGHYAEMDTGHTTLAFSQTELAESLVPGGYVKSSTERNPANILIAFEPEDVKETLKLSLAHGASIVADVELKPWGWVSAMIRDPEGNLIELAKESPC